MSFPLVPVHRTRSVACVNADTTAASGDSEFDDQSGDESGDDGGGGTVGRWYITRLCVLYVLDLHGSVPHEHQRHELHGCEDNTSEPGRVAGD